MLSIVHVRGSIERDPSVTLRMWVPGVSDCDANGSVSLLAASAMTLPSSRQAIGGVDGCRGLMRELDVDDVRAADRARAWASSPPASDRPETANRETCRAA